MMKIQRKAIRIKVDPTNLTLNQVLYCLDFAAKPSPKDKTGMGYKDIFDIKGTLLFTGNANDVWNWLRANDYIW